jgi:hypothetical protein
MNERRSNSLAPLLVTTLLVGLCVAYVGGYFAAVIGFDFLDPNYGIRLYTYRWQVVIFTPAAAVESMFFDRDVVLESAIP